MPWRRSSSWLVTDPEEMLLNRYNHRGQGTLWGELAVSYSGYPALKKRAVTGRHGASNLDSATCDMG